MWVPTDATRSKVKMTPLCPSGLLDSRPTDGCGLRGAAVGVVGISHVAGVGDVAVVVVVDAGHLVVGVEDRADGFIAGSADLVGDEQCAVANRVERIRGGVIRAVLRAVIAFVALLDGQAIQAVIRPVDLRRGKERTGVGVTLLDDEIPLAVGGERIILLEEQAARGFFVTTCSSKFKVDRISTLFQS